MSNALEKRDGASFATLRFGDHAVCLYDHELDKLKVLVAMVEQALDRREKVFCVIEESGQDSLLRELQRNNRDVTGLQKSGQLSFLFPDATARRNEGANAQALLTFYETALYRATAQGFTGLCALSVMDAFLPLHGDDRPLLTFESSLHTKDFASKSIMVCFYCKASLRPALLMEMIKCHPWIILGGQLNCNSFHLPANVVPNAGRVESELAQAVQSLAEANKEEQAPPAPELLPAEPPATDKTIRLLKALNACYPVIFKAEQEKALFEEICRLLVAQGGYRMAWAGLTDHGPERLIRPVAESGFEPGFLGSLHVSWAAGAGAGPAGAAIRSGEPVILRQIQSSPAHAPWREQAARRGYESAACLPITDGNQSLGILNLFSAEADAFGHDETAGLQQLSRSIGIGLTALRNRIGQGRLEDKRLFPDAILRTLDQPVALLDADGVILFANAAFLRAWECDHEEDVRGQSLAAITDRPEQTASLLRQLWETGHAFGLVRSRLKSGRDLSTPLDATAIRDEMGRPVRILALFGPGAENRLQEKWLTLERDRDELLAKMEKMSAELKAAHDAAEVASHTKNDFLAGMSHELRTPLNAIIGFSEVLLEPHFGALAPKQAEYLNHILESGLHLQGLIDDILTISKVETGSLVLQPRPVALRPLLDECLAPFGSKCENQGLSLRLIVQESACDLTFQADAGRLKQVLANLLDNAVKFTPEGGQILVTARLLETAESAQENPAYPSPYSLPRITQRQPAVTFPCVEIVVSDSGIGIDKDHLETVFSEFFQVRNSPHRKPAGTGLGLALTRRFVNMHGGQVWAESAGSGKGSRLVCILPLNAQPES